MASISRIRGIGLLGSFLDVKPKTERRMFTFWGKRFSIRVRPLTYLEVQRLLIKARRSDKGWFDNQKLLNFLVWYGLTRAERERIGCDKSNAYLVAHVAREVWFVTLRHLANMTKELGRALDITLAVPVPRPYTPTKLATPGVLYKLAEESAVRDEERALHLWLKAVCPGARDGDRVLTGAEAEAAIVTKRELVVPRVLQEFCGERVTVDAIPSQVLASFAARAMTYERLLLTIDWVQYSRIVECFNVAVNVLVYRSNQLGGLIVGPQDVKQNSGTPALFELIESRNARDAVLFAMLDDILTNNWTRVPARDQERIRKAFNGARAKIKRQRPQAGEDPGVRSATFVREFLKLAPKNDAFVNRLCFAYWEAFLDDRKRRLDAGVAKWREEVENFIRNAPCQVLVEGPADYIVIEACLLVRKPHARIRVVRCVGKQQVVSRYKALREDSFAGAIVTVVDQDAEKEHKDLERMGEGRPMELHVRHAKGAVENQVPAEVHLRALDQWASGHGLTLDLLTTEEPIENVLSRVLWQRRTFEFDKVEHAKAVAADIRATRIVPEKLKDLIDKTIALAERAERQTPRPENPAATDAAARLDAFTEALNSRPR